LCYAKQSQKCNVKLGLVRLYKNLNDPTSVKSLSTLIL